MQLSKKLLFILCCINFYGIYSSDRDDFSDVSWEIQDFEYEEHEQLITIFRRITIDYLNIDRWKEESRRRKQYLHTEKFLEKLEADHRRSHLERRFNNPEQQKRYRAGKIAAKIMKSSK